MPPTVRKPHSLQDQQIEISPNGMVGAGAWSGVAALAIIIGLAFLS